MKYKQCIGQINAHGRSQISAMIQNQQNNKQFVTIAHDGMIKIWNVDTLLEVTNARIRCGYLTSLINYQKGFLVGTGNGQIIKFSYNENKLQKEWTKKIHLDCVNDMIQVQNYLITIGSDGKVYFMTKPTLSIERQIDLNVPLTKITKVYEDILYIVGNPSYKINIRTFEVSKQRRSLQFLQYKNKILSCSDEKGLQLIQHSENRQNIIRQQKQRQKQRQRSRQKFRQKQLILQQRIDCEFMLQFKNRLITVSQQMMGLIDIKRQQLDEIDEEIKYSFYKIIELKKGYAIKAGFSNQNYIVLAGQDGQVYKFIFTQSNQ